MKFSIKKKIMITIILACSVSISMTACADKVIAPQCKISQPAWATEFNRVYILDEFRIYWSDLNNSQHKLLQTKDTNNNQIPDYVENIALQAKNSRDMFKLAGFRSPLDSPRYKNNATSIAIFLQNIKGNGSAFEMPAQHPNIAASEKMPCSIVLIVSTNLDGFPGTWTIVSHELFHLYSYGYAQFKNAWYSESIANWAERSLRVDNSSGTQRLGPLPQNQNELQQQVFKVNYTTIWRRLFYINDTDVLKIPDEMLKRRYVGGSKVFLDHEWRGTKFVLRFMQNLEKESDKISKQRQWPQYYWKEKDQHLIEWDPIIFGLIQKQLQQPAYDQKEIQFMRKVAIEDLKGK